MQAAQLNDRSPINAGSKVSWLTHMIKKNNVYEQKLTFREKKETAISQKRIHLHNIKCFLESKYFRYKNGCVEYNLSSACLKPLCIGWRILTNEQATKDCQVDMNLTRHSRTGRKGRF